MADELAEAASTARGRATEGDFGPAIAFLEAHGADPGAAPFVRALNVMRVAAGLADVEALPGAIAERNGDGGDEARSADALARATAARLYACSCDVDASQRASMDANAIAPPLSDEAAGAVRLAALWSSLETDDARAAIDAAATIQADMARIGAAPLVIEAASLGAAAARVAGDDERALSLARRASRMARTESLPQLEYLAHLVLARERADGGHSHLATRILVALGRVAPPVWSGAIGLELALLGEVEEARGPLERGAPWRATRVGRALIAFIEASQAGAGADSRSKLSEATREAEGSPWLSRRISILVDALDPHRSFAEIVDEETRSFVTGKGSLPKTLVGVSGTPIGTEAIGTPYALGRPGHETRRVLGLGLSLMPEPPVVLGADGDRKHRTRHAAAALLFAGPSGLPRTELFQRVYGFRFRSVTHQSVLDVLLHRVREYLGDAASMSRDDEEVRLDVRLPVAVPEAPADRPLDDLVLRAVARNPGLSARALSKELGVALRSVQTSLRSLVESGDCQAERKGRVIEYRVEDTTFSEPTCLTIVT